MPTRNVNLTDHFDRFIDEGVTSGRFSNASEMVREALRLLEQRQEEDRARIEWLRGEVQKGMDAMDRGDYVEIRSAEDLEGFMERIGERVVKRHQAGLSVRPAAKSRG